MLAAGLLLTCSVFSKQTTVVPAVALASVALLVPVLSQSRRTWRWGMWLSAATVLFTFVCTSVLLGVFLQAMSHGYAYDLLVRDPVRYARVVPLGSEIDTSLRYMAVPLATLAVVMLCVVLAFVADRQRVGRRDVLVVLSALLVAVSPIPTAILAEAKLGGRSNQLIGPVWTLTLGATVLLLVLRPSVRQLMAAALTVAVLLTGAGPFAKLMREQRLATPRLYHTATWRGVDPYLSAALDNGQIVFNWAEYPSLSVSPKVPGYPAGDWADLFTAGYVPRYFIQHLIDGRYALVERIRHGRREQRVLVQPRPPRRIDRLEVELVAPAWATRPSSIPRHRCRVLPARLLASSSSAGSVVASARFDRPRLL